MEFFNKKQHEFRKGLVHDLIQFARFEGIYDQIRYLDEYGMEKIRINFNKGHPGSIGKEQLQNKADRYYFKDTIKLNRNEIFMSPMDLNIENGKIEFPLKPMIRIAAPVFNKKGEKKGIIIINYLSKNLLNALNDKKITSTTHSMMLNRNGYFLKAISRNEEWGFMYEDKKHLTFKNKFPESWKNIISSEKGTFMDKFGFFSFNTIFPMKENIKSSSGASTAFESSKKAVNADEYQWKIVFFVPKIDFEQNIKVFKKNVIILDVLISFIMIIITWFLAVSFHRKKKAEIKLKIAHDELEFKVTERTKELNCMYQMAKLSGDREIIIKDVLEEMLNIIPLGFGFPGIAESRIAFDDLIVQSKGFGSDSYILTAPLIVAGNIRGSIEIIYSEKRPDIDEGPFQTEERALIDSLSKQLAGIITKKENSMEKEKLKEQLVQAQKMEAIGLLSGGIAHDFNNMLTVINGFAELGMMSTQQQPGLCDNFEQIIQAGKKAANLTRQLLVFSRKDAIQPVPVQINDSIKHTMKLLKRLIGEDIGLEVDLGSDISNIRADQTQVDQLLFNLVINARDAINSKTNDVKKKIIITTKQVILDKDYTEQFLDIKEGSYILIEVIDSGIGMGREIQEQIFTPFFSTKEKKKGTGLGLSTVYGIIKQNKGNIAVYSEVGIGTTFRIYWPALEQRGDDIVTKSRATKSIPIEKAKILVVEDDEKLNLFACNALNLKNIEILSAFDGSQAIDLCEEHKNSLDLIFTDVVLPKKSGPDLVKEALKICPGIKVLYTSGYTESFFSEDGILPTDINFLRKPYSVQNLYEKIALVLQKD
ncbi:MAG: response regulator [Desulfobacteraceae bacterium]|nr:response regulator [Desulfobacteraceae bacterium]